MSRPSGRKLEKHEALCRRCGRCCYHKILLGDEVLFTDIPCPYLDVESCLCTVYENRSEKNPDCLDVEAGIARRVFPADCPYVADLPGYRPPRTDPDADMIAEILDDMEDEEFGP